jgi:hypothetical protein
VVVVVVVVVWGLSLGQMSNRLERRFFQESFRFFRMEH